MALNLTITDPVANDTMFTKIDEFIIRNIFLFNGTLYVLYVLLFVFGVVGNSIVIYVLMSSIFLNRPSTASGGGCGAPTNLTTVRQSIVTAQQSPTPTQQQQQQQHSQQSPISRSGTHNNSFRQLVKRNEDNRFSSPSVKYLIVEEEEARRNKNSLTTISNNKTGELGDSMVAVVRTRQDRSNSCKYPEVVSSKQVRAYYYKQAII